jgi:hypothetical protein
MEFASEMLIKSQRAGYRIEEAPVHLLPDQRSRPPHLHTWRDGWRHLRFMVLHAPDWAFSVPVAVAGAASVALAAMAPLSLASPQASYKTAILASAMASIATVAGWCGYVAKDSLGNERRGMSVRTTALVALVVTLCGLGLLIAQFASGGHAGLETQPDRQAMLLTAAGGFLLSAGGTSCLFALLVGLVRNLR